MVVVGGSIPPAPTSLGAFRGVEPPREPPLFHYGGRKARQRYGAMPVITLPDGSQRQFDRPVSVADVAADIGAGLARAALAGKVDGALVDTSFVIENDADVAIVTAKDDEGLEVIRHSTAHLLAQAVKQLFPAAQVTIGPVIEDGFYYDFAFDRPFTPEDLGKIEARMKKLAAEDLEVAREVVSRDAAVAYFESQGEHYKAEIVADIPEGEEIGLYGQGDWKDLCRGPHVPSTGKLKAFRLTKLAGAYWRGDSNNEMLQRIYGTAWPDKQSLKDYLHRLEEAEKRDHRRFGKQLDLFHTQPEAPGMVFWHDKGWRLYRLIQDYIRGRLTEHGYQEVRTPQILDRSLWEKSGHWDKYAEHMFTTGSEDRQYAIKPMNCPCHVQIYNQHLHSYRDLPIRMAEFGSCHRNEASGTLHGLMRVRNFTQDDAHIFCTEDQIQSEVAGFVGLLMSVYAALRWIKSPACAGRTTWYKKARHEQQNCAQIDPVTDHVEVGKDHVSRATHQRDQVITEPAQKQGRQKIDHHDHAVHGDELQVTVGIDKRESMWKPQLQAHHYRQD